MQDEFSSGLLALVPRLRVQALALTRDRTAAEDLVQDTLAGALAARDSFASGTNLGAWAHTILRNRFVSTLRRRRRTVDLEAAPEAAFARGAEQEDKLVLEDLGRALGRLPPERREALVMAVVLGMPHEAIAAATGCAEGTAKSRVSRARRSLKAMLLGEEIQSGPGPGEQDRTPSRRNHPARRGGSHPAPRGP